jgi:hypothetical protein
MAKSAPTKVSIGKFKMLATCTLAKAILDALKRLLSNPLHRAERGTKLWAIQAIPPDLTRKLGVG